MCFDILRRGRLRQGRLLDVCPVDTLAQGNILSDCVWDFHLTGLQFVYDSQLYAVSQPLNYLFGALNSLVAGVNWCH